MEIDNHTLSRPINQKDWEGIQQLQHHLPVQEIEKELFLVPQRLRKFLMPAPSLFSPLLTKQYVMLMRCDSSERVSRKHNNNNSNGSIHEIERTGDCLPDGIVASLFLVAMTNNKLSSMKTT
ncbi:hypothetical protein SADUNF_Sadunf04G0151100 [Salix dunnii]|uniref:Uncharacterized protein n=1 Tax=Salix dunnii TaxID=1413687 RepID=A0A835KA37_9ROSI|nr:hypothetical protein SADUNF_Sadunf04G0151100 [Salix dunnii]